MAKRRRAVPIVLTHEQRKRLENLWFVYGNYGPKTTRGNHSFIQGLLERGEDERPLRIKGYIPTEECESAVDRILGRGEAEHIQADKSAGDEEQRESTGHLRLVAATEQKKHLAVDPEMKAITEEIKGRQKKRGRVSSETPDAA